MARSCGTGTGLRRHGTRRSWCGHAPAICAPYVAPRTGTIGMEYRPSAPAVTCARDFARVRRRRSRRVARAVAFRGGLHARRAGYAYAACAEAWPAAMWHELHASRAQAGVCRAYGLGAVRRRPAPRPFGAPGGLFGTPRVHHDRYRAGFTESVVRYRRSARAVFIRPANQAQSARRQLRDRRQDDVGKGLQRRPVTHAREHPDRPRDARRAGHPKVRGRVAHDR